jgi:hypothetical protein
LRVSSKISFTGEAGVISGRISELVLSAKREIPNVFSFEMRVTAAGTAVALLKNMEEKELREAPTPLIAGNEYQIAFMNYDDTIMLTIDGEVVASFADNAPIIDKAAYTSRSGVSLAVEGLQVAFADLKIWRDIYYTNFDGGALGQNGGRITVPPGMYWVMGDNSPESSDSRYWGFVPENALEGRALLAWWPPWRIGIIR